MKKGEDVLVKACKLKFYGGHYGTNMLPTPFLCLLLKLLQIQPDIAIIHEFIDNEDFKYLRILGAFYFRLVASAKEIYQKLEPLYSDYRKVKFFNQVKQIELQHIDEIIDQLLRNERFCGITMPNIQKRFILEEFSGLPPRVSKLDEDLKNYEVSSSEDEEKEEK